MKKAFFFVPAIVLFSLIQVCSAHAIHVNVKAPILELYDITKDTDWITLDFTGAKLWENNITSLYVMMFTGVESNCPSDTVQFWVRPFGDDDGARIQFARSSSGSNDEHVQYVWLPINSTNKIEYKITDISCSNAKVSVRLYVLGFDLK